MSQPDWLAASKHADLLTCLHHMAWADGALRPVERDSVVRLVRSLGVEVSRADVIVWLMEKPTDAAMAPSTLDPFDRRFLLSQAIRLGHEDGHYDDDERARVVHWASAFGMSSAELAALEAEVLKDMGKSSADPFQ